jgi:superfamily I DNA/RNA helicase
LIKAVPVEGSFTFFGDIAQQIYGNSLSWKASGIDAKKIWRFENNYRNPIEIAQFAQDILKHPKWEQKGEEYVVSKFECPAAGIKPILIKYSNERNEFIEIAKLLKNHGGRNVIIVKNRQIVGDFLSELKKNDISAKEIKKENSSAIDDGVYVTTFYSAKGLEFDNVFIPFLNEGDYPDPKKLEESENKEKVYSNALKLLYVAVTRAKQSVVMSYSSTLTELFPHDSSNYIKRNI